MIAVVFLLSLLLVSGTSKTLSLYTLYSDSERYNSSVAITAVNNTVKEFSHLLPDFTVNITFIDIQVSFHNNNTIKLLFVITVRCLKDTSKKLRLCGQSFCSYYWWWMFIYNRCISRYCWVQEYTLGKLFGSLQPRSLYIPVHILLMASSKQ